MPSTAGLLSSGKYGVRCGLDVFCKAGPLWEFTDADRPIRNAPINLYLRSRTWLGSRDTIAAFPEGGEVYLYVRPAAVGYTLVYPPDEPYYSQMDYATIAAQIRKNRPKCILMTVDSAPAFLAPSSPLRAPITEDYEELGRLGNTVIFRLKGGA